MFLWLYDRLRHRQTLLFVVWYLVLSVAVVLATHISLKEDIGDFLGRDGLAAKYMGVYQKIGGQDRIAIIVTAPELEGDVRTDSIEAAMMDFEVVLAEIDTAGIVRDVAIETDETEMLNVVTALLDAGPLLLTEADYRRADSLLSTTGYLDSALVEARQQLSLPTSALTTPILRRDPLHLFAPVLQRLGTLRQGNDYVVRDDIIFTSDGRAAVGFVRSPFASSDSGNNRMLGALLDEVCERLMGQHTSVNICAVGAPLIAVTNADRIRTDGLIAGILSVILIALILWYVFRRASDILWMLVSLITGYAIAIAIIGLYRDELSVIVLGTSSVLIGIAANYPLHFLDHLRHEPDRRRALADMVPPLLTGNITTVSAFACLAWMDSEAMRDLGIMGALVLVGTILFVLVVLPVMVKERKVTKEDTEETADIKDTPRKGSAIVLWAVIAATVVLGYFSLQTTFDTNMQHINYMTPVQRENLSLLGIGLESSAAGSVLFVAEDSTTDAALARAENMVDSLRNSSLNVRSLAGLMPSRQSQEASLQRWNALLNKHGELLRHELPRRAAKMGFAANAFGPFAYIVENDYTADAADQICQPLADMVAAQYILSDDSTHAQVIAYATAQHPLTDEVKDNWRERLGNQCFLFDRADLQSSLTRTLSDNFNYIGFVCGFVVFAFLWFSFGSIELSLMSFLPLAVGWVWILGIMQLLGIQFNIVNIILATFIFGQGDDYTIFITDGLIYEHTYGRRVLRSYRQSVLLSAIIMFVGIGTLIFARHPAMHSLAEVVIVGMATVVVMAFYLPPLVFRWLTREGGQLREVPLTFERVAFTVFASVFYLVVASVYQIFAFVWSHAGRYTEARRLFFHRTLCRISRFCIEHVPGTTWSVSNPHDERLERPAIIVCNHQSQLDLVALLSIAPKVCILTKKWVWRNPLYSLILRAAEFYPVSEGVEETDRHLADLIRRGYSIVIFPEGTRSRDCQIHRFHKGAFEFARNHGVDILPVYLTGLGRVLPKDELAFRRGNMYMEIGQRYSISDHALGETSRETTRFFHQLFVSHYAELRRQHERTADVVPYVRYQYRYKVRACEREANRRLDKILREAEHIDAWAEGTTCHLPQCGQGELAYVFALVHPDVQVLATDPDADNIAVARNININLPNLRFEVQKTEEQ